MSVLATALEPALARGSSRPLVLGLCGAPGSGKSTAAGGLVATLRESGRNAAILSLDDLYLTLADREALAAIHPLLRLRGAPGTHDPRLGLALLERLGRPGVVRPPRFDKACDDRRPEIEWDEIVGPAEVVVLEGWCVGAAPQAPEALAWPVNELETAEDADGQWRAFVNATLAADYQPMFARIDMLALIAAPGFQVVAGWRREQEAALRRDLAACGKAPARCMSDDEVARFVQTYQRLTEHILDEMPARADIVIRLDAARAIVGVETRA